MPEFDLPLEKLQVYRPDLTRAGDFNSFWKETLSQLDREDLDPRLEPVEYPAGQARVFRAHFRGWGGSPLQGWYVVPPGDGPFPGLVEYHGYSGMSAEPNTFFQWALQGYAVLGIDVRGQSGGSADNQIYPGGHATGWMTQGILSPEIYYYRGVYADTVSALNFLRSRSEVDSRRLGVMGMSQGGGLSVAAAALDQGVKLSLPEMPYLAHYRRALQVAQLNPYLEIAVYLRRFPQREEQVWQTLSYFDIMNLAPEIRCPVLMTVGLQDTICPPSTVFAAYNHLASARKEMKVYPYHDHVRVDVHWLDKFIWARHELG